MVKPHLKAKETKDPEKQALKQNASAMLADLKNKKKVLNGLTSLFIKNLIQYKKLINGYPVSYYMQRSKIHEPIPGDPLSKLSELSKQYEQIVTLSNIIIEKQNEYSEFFKKIHNKQLNANRLNNLESLASNPFSRFLAKIKNLSLTDSDDSREKKYRMNMLNISYDIYKKINEFEYSILKSDPESTFESIKLFEKVKKDWFLFKKNIQIYTDSSFKISKDVIEARKILKNIKDLAKKYKSDESQKYIADLTRLETSFNTNVDNIKIKETEDDAKKIIEIYNKLIHIDESQLNNSLNSELESKANDPFTRMLMKTKHKLLNNFNKSSAIRIDCYNKSEVLKNSIESIMDSLEDAMDIEYLNSVCKTIDDDIESLDNILNVLQENIKGIDKSDSFMSLLKKKKITDINLPLTEEEEKKLRDYERRRRIRDLIDINK